MRIFRSCHQLVKKIKATGVNVLLIQKSILRDATTDLSLHYLAKAKIMVIRDIERDEIEFISKVLSCALFRALFRGLLCPLWALSLCRCTSRSCD